MTIHICYHIVVCDLHGRIVLFMLSGYSQLRGYYALSSRDALDNTAARVNWSYPVPIAVAIMVGRRDWQFHLGQLQPVAS